MSQGVRIPLVEGSVIRWPFQLKQSGQNASPDVSGATMIRIEWEIDSVPQTPITLNIGEVGANWSTGLVVALFDTTNVTAAVGDYDFTLTVFLNGEEVPYDTGTIEVRKRPGYPTP